MPVNEKKKRIFALVFSVHGSANYPVVRWKTGVNEERETADMA